MAETMRQAKAFDLYFTMGDNRSYEKVGKQIGVSTNSVATWAKKYNWQQRLSERNAAIHQEMYAKTDKEIMESLTDYKKIIHDSVQDYVKNLKSGKVKINSPGEFIKLVELDVKLTEILDNDNSNNNEGETGTVINFNLTRKE